MDPMEQFKPAGNSCFHLVTEYLRFMGTTNLRFKATGVFMK